MANCSVCGGPQHGGMEHTPDNCIDYLLAVVDKQRERIEKQRKQIELGALVEKTLEQLWHETACDRRDDYVECLDCPWFNCCQLIKQGG